MRLDPGFLALLALSATLEQVFGRESWLEKDGKVVYLYPRRFGQEQPPAIQKIRDACSSAVCGTLAGQAVTPLLAAQPECSQQDMADSIIDASKNFDVTTAAAMVAAAIEYRQAEKNTPPDFTRNPPALRNSVFCQKAPKNPELIGLVQAQDPANNPNLFFDPATNETVLKGSQANTAPFNVALQSASASSTVTGIHGGVVATRNPNTTVITVTVTVIGAIATSTSSDTAAPFASTPASADVSFGSCSIPEIEFGVGFDNRKETSFQPSNKQSYNHGSAQNIAIITQFICDTLTNSCHANQAAKDLCANATQAAGAAAAKTGVQADVFNAMFSIITDFAAVPVVNDHGQTIFPGISGTVATSSGSVTAQATGATSTPTAISSSSIGNFGKCSVPQIEFGAGFDGRKETSFQPTNKTSFSHGSAQNIDIITQFICDTLTNSCGADQMAKNTCARGRVAATAASRGTGAQADAFNSAFGIQTKFATVTPLDNQGKSVGMISQATLQPSAILVAAVQVSTVTAQAPPAGTVPYSSPHTYLI